MSSGQSSEPTASLFGHPTGLFTLFFAELWERFSYYGMRALLLFYMLKGFLGYGDSDAYAIYGAYTALVYMTPFFGGMVADRLLGARRAVILGGLLMAAGHLMMTIETGFSFYTALALLIAGNGFFKPNISTMVGSLYPPGSPKRDGGFTIFYMGINLGAAMSPLLCGYIGEVYDWHYGFGLATIGMLTGIAVFVAPSVFAQVSMFAVAIFAAYNTFQVDVNSDIALPMNIAVLVLLVVVGFISFAEMHRKQVEETQLSRIVAIVIILAGAVAAAVGLFTYLPENPFSQGLNIFVGVALLAAGAVATIALTRGGLPKSIGAAPDDERLRKPAFGPISAEIAIYLVTLACIPVLAVLVSANRQVTLIPSGFVENLEESGNPVFEILAVFLSEMSKPAGLILLMAGIGAFVYLGREAVRQPTVARQRMYVVLVLTFFSMLFWAFFEQAGSSINNFTDRNVDRVYEERHVTKEAVEKKERITFRIPLDTNDSELAKLPILSQEQLGYRYGNKEEVQKRIEQAIRAGAKEKKDLEKRLAYLKKLQSAKSDTEELEAIEKAIKKDQKDIDETVAAVNKKNVLTMTGLTYLRALAKTKDSTLEQKKLTWQFTEGNVGMGIGGSEIPATMFQALNPIYILLFGIVFSALWTFLGQRGMEPSTPVKFALGLLQLGLGFVAIWYGALLADERGMVALSWLFIGYLLHTTGELCLSPVGLSMVTKLSPGYLVSTVMGMWFLATAFSQFLAAIIAQFTGVGHGGSAGIETVPIPAETVEIYGGVFGKIAIVAIASALFCLILSPLLTRWMHEDKEPEGASVPPPEPESGPPAE